MAPPTKRKRGDRHYSQDSSDAGGRPSPHRPQDMNLAQGNRQNNRGGGNSGGGGRRGGRGGGRGAASSPTSPQGIAPLTPQQITSNTMPPPTSGPPVGPTNAASQGKQPSSQTQRHPQPPIQSQTASLPPYHYEYLTPHRISTWQATGRSEIIEKSRQALLDDDWVEINVIYQELVRASLDGTIAPTLAGQTVKEVIFDNPNVNVDDASSQFLDVLSIMLEGTESSARTLQPLVAATGIDPMKMRKELEYPLLSAFGLVHDTFKRISIRKATNEMYRQSAFNLLREESEGYSKLMTEYYQAASMDKATYLHVVDVFEKIKALIGTFDLDTGRVLDVTLDVFASLLVKRYGFFVKFLRLSYWWPNQRVIEGYRLQDDGFQLLPQWTQPGSEAWSTSVEEREATAPARHARDAKFWERVREAGALAFFEIGGRRVFRKESKANSKLRAEELADPKSDATQEWIRVTNTLPPVGNSIAAQLLGFKLRFYASNTRDAQDSLPDNLIFLAALLIRVGFLSLVDLYPHLYPPDDAMPAHQERLQKERLEREKKNRPGGGAMNALLMAGALADDTLPPPGVNRLREEARSSSAKPDGRASTPAKDDNEDSAGLPEPVDQKHKLLLCLLLNGAIPESLFILGRFPWLMDVYPDVPEHFHRMLHHCVGKVYEASVAQAPPDDVRDFKKPVTEATGLPKGNLAFSDAPPRKIMRWANIERLDCGPEGLGYKYYFDDWTDNVPVCQSVDDIFTFCGTLLNVSGVKIGRDTKLMSKLARIGNRSLVDDQSEDNKKRWLDLAKRLLVPALSLAGGNSGVINDVYSLLQHYPTPVRYNVYAEWYTGPTSRLPDIKAAFDISRAETRDVLKRISKENVKLQARALAKVANGSPGIVFSVTLNQIESYSNLIQVVIECARYFTNLGYDVLTWSLLNSLGGKGRDAMQADGMLTSPWLRALSTFSGGVIKHYDAVDPTPLLQYICYQLRRGNSTDLEILEALLGVMTGIRADTDFNDSQMKAMQGGPLLRSRILVQVNDERSKPEVEASAARLMRALVDHGLASLLLIALAQERQIYVFRDDNKDVPLKVAASNLDKLHKVFLQYLDVLRTNLETSEFNSLVPGVVELIRDFGLEPGLAFTIARPSITKEIEQAEVEQKQSAEAANSPAAERPNSGDGDVEMSAVNGQKDHPSAEDKGSKDADDTIMGDASVINGEQSVMTPASQAPKAPEEPQVIQELAGQLKDVLSSTFEEHLSLSFYARFWQLSLVDLHFPIEQVQSETQLIKRQAAETRADRSDVSQAGVRKRTKKAADLEALNENLWTEAKHYMNTLSTQKRALKREAQHWFKDVPSTERKRVHNAVLQECFLPRVTLSAADSHFCYRFLLHLHTSGTVGFHTVTLLDQLFLETLLAPLVFEFTQFEAELFGNFLNDILQELSKWHKSKSEYERCTRGNTNSLPGFSKSIDPVNRLPTRFLEFDEYRSLLYKWHSYLLKALLVCLSGGEYMHIRNAIKVLSAVHKVFPAVDFMGNQLITAVETLSEKEEREDLKVMARSLTGHLKKMSKTWVMPQAFRPGPLGANSNTGSAKPQPGVGTSLNAAAPEYRPSGQPTHAARRSGEDSEDGEIDDARQATARARQATEETSGASRSDTAPTSAPLAGTADSGSTQDTDAQQDSRPTVATDRPASIPPRPEDNRSTPTQPAASRVQHALPTRPDSNRSRPGDRPLDSRLPLPPQPFDDRRQAPNADYGRSDRRGESYGYRDGRERSPPRSARGRTPERDRRETSFAGARDGREHPEDRRGANIPRDPRADIGRPGYNDSPRHGRETYGPDARTLPGDTRGRLHGNPATTPSSGAPFHGTNRETKPNDRLPRQLPNPPPRYEPPTPAVEQGGVNPERARLIEAQLGNAPKDGPRLDHGPRPHSPSRRDDRHLPSADFSGRRGEFRDDRSALDRPGSSGYDRRDDASGMPPSGPRSDRGPHVEQHPARDLFNSHSTNIQQRPVDQNAGRLSRDDLPPPPRPQPDVNSGRLNAGHDIPSGPRGRSTSSRGEARNFGGPWHPSSSPSSERPPSAPFNSRRDVQSSANHEPLGQRISAPSTPTIEQPPELPGVHPSRLQQLKGTPTIQTDLSNPPAGPRGVQRNGAPASGLPSLSNRNPPSGPASASDRDRSSRTEDKRFAGVNNILKDSNSSDRKDANAPGALDRSNSGRAPRLNHRQSHNSLASPATPIGSGAPQQPTGTNNNNGSRPGPSENTAPQDDGRSADSSRRGERDRSDRERRHRRSSKSPRRSSREGSSRRDRPEEPSRSDKRSGNAPSGPHDPIASSNTTNSGRDRERESSRREHGSSHRDRSDREGRDREKGTRDATRSGEHAVASTSNNGTSSRSERRREDRNAPNAGVERADAAPHAGPPSHPNRGDGRRGQTGPAAPNHNNQQPPVPPSQRGEYGSGPQQYGHGDNRNGELRIRGADRERERREGGASREGGGGRKRGRGEDSLGGNAGGGGAMGGNGGGHADKRPRRSQG